MGVSWNHEVYFICENDETTYVESLPDRLPGIVVDNPVYDKKVDGNVVSFNSSGYNIYDLFGHDFPRPESWSMVVHRIIPCQGQEFDVVDWISRSEYDEQMEQYDGDEEDLEFYNPMSDYTDPGSEYWEENSHLNVYSEGPNYNDLDEDDEEYDDLYDQRYEQWYNSVDNCQEKDVQDGIKMGLNQLPK